MRLGSAGDDAVFGGASGGDVVAFEGVASVCGGACEWVAVGSAVDVECAAALRTAGVGLADRNFDADVGAHFVWTGKVVGVEFAKDVVGEEEATVACAVKGGVGEVGGDALGAGVDVAPGVGGIAFYAVDVPVAYGEEGEVDFGVGDAVVVNGVAGAEDDRKEGD